jgi:phosphoribosyl 1,2-cyclic phosphate phosphodiesterase
MRVTILGCGGSTGVPMVGEVWGNCDPKNPKNTRLRSSVLVEEGDVTLLIDSSPDLRAQLLREKVKNLSAVFYTHMHGDHCHGIDDLRAVSILTGKMIDVYADQDGIDELQQRFEYMFRRPKDAAEHLYKPVLTPHVLNGPVEIQSLKVIPFEQDHVNMKTLGYRLGKFAYSIDCKNLSDQAFETLTGIELWVVDCARRKEHPTHSHLAQTLAWIERVKPKQALLTHMGTDLDYETLCRELPAHVRPAYDGLRVEL